MAFIRRAFQRGIARRRLGSENEIDRVTGALKLLDVGGHESINNLIFGLEDPSWNVRNACSLALVRIYERKPSIDLVKLLHEEIKETGLAKRLAIIESIGKIAARHQFRVNR